MPLQKRLGKRWCNCVTSGVKVFEGSERVMESTSNSASTITQTQFVQVVFWDGVHLADFRHKGSPRSLLSGGFTVDGFVSLFTTVHTEIVVKVVLLLFWGEFPTFLKWGMSLSLGGVNFCVTVFCR